MPEDSRELGVELGELQETLENQEYPIGHDELLEEHGDETVEMSGNTTTLEELIGPLNEDEYRDYGEVEQAIMNMVSDEAIGRKNYSDRTPPATGEDRQDEGDRIRRDRKDRSRSDRRLVGQAEPQSGVPTCLQQSEQKRADTDEYGGTYCTPVGGVVGLRDAVCEDVDTPTDHDQIDENFYSSGSPLHCLELGLELLRICRGDRSGLNFDRN